jgi:hypothetical protein
MKVRSETAEYLYVLLQSADLGFETEAVEDILLETEWYVKLSLPFLEINSEGFFKGRQPTSKSQRRQQMRWPNTLRSQ